jgi:hypothetical protein
LVRKSTRADERREDRLARLFHLQEQRVATIGNEEADETTRTDAPDADDLDRDVEQRIAIEERALIFAETRSVGIDYDSGSGIRGARQRGS